MLQVGELGLRAVILTPRLCGLRGLRGHPRMIGASAARHMAHPPPPPTPTASFAPQASWELAASIPCPPLSSRPLYESRRLADPYTPVSGGGLLDFDHPPSSVQKPGSGYRPPAGGPYLLGRTPSSSHVRFHLPASGHGEFTTPAHPRVQVSRSQPVSDLQHRPPTPSTPAPVTCGQGLSAQDIDF